MADARKAVLALDHGTKRTGFAASDPMRIATRPLEVWSGAGDSPELLERVAELVEEFEADTVLVSDRGTPLNYSTVRNTFRSLCRQVGWKSNGARRRPRLYDLRHTFACRREHGIENGGGHDGHCCTADTAPEIARRYQ